MRIAHFGYFAPNQSGQYATVKDMIRAERQAGMDAQFIDFNGQSRIGLKDDWLETVNMDFACEADWIIRHSAIPKKIRDLGRKTILALHGRPENSFRLEDYGKNPVISEVLDSKADGYITFWSELTYQWEAITGKRVRFIHAPVDLERFNPEGFRHKFSPSGSPNILICDMWREDVTPFNVIMAAAYFTEHLCPTAKVHVYGMPTTRAFSKMEEKGILGEVLPLVQNIETAMRSADIMVTPQVIATRSVREAMACGLPIVAGGGNAYTLYRHDPRDIEGFARQILRCWHDLQKWDLRGTARKIAEREFRLDGHDVARVLDEISNSL